MKPQRLLNLSIVFLIPLILLAVLMTGAALAAPAATSDHNPVGFLPSEASDSFSIVARRVISIPFIVDNDKSALPPSTGDQIVARRVISIPFIVDNDNSALPLSTGDQIAARRVISIPFFIDNSALPPSAVGL